MPLWLSMLVAEMTTAIRPRCISQANNRRRIGLYAILHALFNGRGSTLPALVEAAPPAKLDNVPSKIDIAAAVGALLDAMPNSPTAAQTAAKDNLLALLPGGMVADMVQ